jgi:competence/damage-inducible protein CinA-like protein
MASPAIRAEVLAIGDEIVQGWTVDTNSGEIARELLAAGVRVERFTAVADERGAIARAIREAGDRAEIVVMTGGLGPTEDDLTFEACAEALGVELEFVPELWERITARLAARRRPIPESNRRQAHRPRGAESIPNPNGTAPGVTFRLGSARFFALPGVPREMRAMFAEFVLPRIAAEGGGAGAYARKLVKCFGAPEAAVGEAIAPWMGREADPLVGITVSRAVHTISILSRDAAKGIEVADAIAAKLGDLVYSRENDALEETLGKELIARGVTVALAESCTGGLATALLTNVPGISAVLRESFVTYSNDAKRARLAVPSEVLEKHGAVSVECAEAMARGACAAAGARLGISITGIAGPDGGTPEKPVGLVFVGIALDGAVRVHRRNFAGLERNFLREVTSREALNLARLAVLGRTAS